MLKRFVSSSLIVLLCLSGCTAKADSEIIPVLQEKEPDHSREDAMAQTIMETLGNSDEMTPVRTRMMVGMLFDGDKTMMKSGVLYLSTLKDDTDTIGVFTTDHLDECMEYVSSYLAQKKAEAEIWSPDEAFKISNATLVDNGKDTIVLIIHKDIAAAASIAESVMKQ
ncbi:MAG: DUF4358 domain-containing protein [Bulleidia sp.]